MGYYLGAEPGRTTLEVTFINEQDSLRASVRAHFVSEVQPNLYLDGFAFLALESKTLKLDNDTLNVASYYTLTTGIVCTLLMRVVAKDGYEFWLQLKLTYRQTHIGMMILIGEAYSLVDDALLMYAGSLRRPIEAFTSELRVLLMCDPSQIARGCSHVRRE